MTNNNIMYKVTGRYMEGQKVIGYHLVGEDGSQAQETKSRVIWLINRGMISNMRIQLGPDNEAIIRGKGINLNNLPVFDIGKQQYRDNDISQDAANTNVNVSKHVKDANAMGQYKILKRIMYKNKCLGYELQDYSGQITRKKREQVIELAVQRLISNAIAQKYKRQDRDIPDIGLRGAGCDLNSLPILIVTDQGKIVDPTVEVSNLTVRSAYMKHSGIITNINTNETIPFKTGDFILCGVNGKIEIKNRLEVEQEYKRDTESNMAICDNYLSSLSNYKIEVFGNKAIQLEPKIIKSWAILKHK